MIPILLNHDQEKPIGKLTMEGSRLIAEFTGSPIPVTRDMLFAIFGGAGALIREYKYYKRGEEDIMRVEILEFSYCPMNEQRKPEDAR